MLEKSNYKTNTTIKQPAGCINGQKVSKIGRMRFGLSTLAKRGSGIIAAYNLFLLLNRPVMLADITREIYIRTRTPLGLLGVHPLQLIRCFSAHYLPVNLERSYTAFCSRLTPGFCGIVFWWTGRKLLSPIHAAAVENDRGRIYVYNRLPNSPKRYEFQSISKLTDSKKFIVGYYINSDEFYN